MKQKIYIGIDVSKDKLDIAVKVAETDGTVGPAKRARETWTSANTTAGCEALVRRLRAQEPHRIAMEGNVPGAVEILGGGLIAPEVILGAVKDKSRHEEDCHKSHQKNR